VACYHLLIEQNERHHCEGDCEQYARVALVNPFAVQPERESGEHQ
jgi:hypothetical protein